MATELSTPPPSQEEFDAELHACFQGDGAMTRFADWLGIDKSQVSRLVSPRYPDKSIFWLFVREGLDPLYRADRATAERVWALLARYNARYNRREHGREAGEIIPAMNRFQELMVRGALGERVEEADLRDAGLRMVEAVNSFLATLCRGD